MGLSWTTAAVAAPGAVVPRSDYTTDVHRRTSLLVLSVVMTILATIFVVLRCISRFLILRNAKCDDYFLVAAMIILIGYMVGVGIDLANGMGFPKDTVTTAEENVFFRVSLAIYIMYYSGVACVKMSIVFTYLRFAISRTFQRLCIGTIVFLGLFWATCVALSFLLCHPYNTLWDVTGDHYGSCITTSSINVAADAWVIALPVRILLHVPRPRRQKIALCCLFGTAGFATVASAVRIYAIHRFTDTSDPYRYGLQTKAWSIIEMSLGICCASVTGMRPIYTAVAQAMAHVRERWSEKRGGAHGNGRGPHANASADVEAGYGLPETAAGAAAATRAAADGSAPPLSGTSMTPLVPAASHPWSSHTQDHRDSALSGLPCDNKPEKQEPEPEPVASLGRTPSGGSPAPPPETQLPLPPSPTPPTPPPPPPLPQPPSLSPSPTPSSALQPPSMGYGIADEEPSIHEADVVQLQRILPEPTASRATGE
ncbi:integral membrane protein [Niveomyces insectorum RCEF 264]|uniref:Integral membrane protein n=1 Tax=Niveomyces insectorum RCEF 264 TaxID=1081102 RepID=A0A167U2M6_9HYPO|nr:integral membrane protein [Niveomyces insectorum RCEF 264]